jgi:flagellar hook-length control protein FliK
MSDMAPLGEQESTQSKAVQAKSLKNDKLGVFAKILEGLIRNPKQAEGAVEGLFTGFQERDSGAAEVKGDALKNGKGKKKVSLSPGEEKNREALGSLSQNKGQNKTGVSETIAFWVPQGLDKGSSESVQKKGFPSSRNPQEKKGVNALQNFVSKTKTPNSPQESVLTEGAIKTKVKPEELSQGLFKTDEGTGKTGEKESRKVGSPILRSVHNRAGEALPVSLNPQQGSGNTEKEARGGSKIAEAKPRDKRRERMGVEVRDLRSWESVQQDIAQGSSPGVDVKSGAESKTVELMVDLSSGTKSREEVFREVENRPVQAFEDILARELYQNLNGDIVRQAQVILKDGGEGTIRLALKPESLGNVKIQLEMAENKITGHIIVETNEALRAFEREIQSLEQAFKDSGFAGANLDTALASGNEGNGADQQWRGGETEPFFSERFATSSYDAVSDRAEELVFSGRSGSGLPLVNMLV